MGRKYASIHIYGQDYKKVMTVIENDYFDKAKELRRELLLKEIQSKDLKAYNQLIKDLKSTFALIIKTNKFISIYDEENTFENINNKVKNLSKSIDYPILYTSNFDDDVFLLGAYKSGKLITNGKLIAELTDPAMKPKQVNIDKLCNTFHLEMTEALADLNSIEEIYKIEKVIEENLQIPLELDIDYVESDTTYIQRFSSRRFCVFDQV